MRSLKTRLVLLLAFTLVLSIPHARAIDITEVVAPDPDIGSLNVGTTATLTFGADYPDNATQSVAIIVVDYNVTGFSYAGFTADMDGADASGQFIETDDPGSLTLRCSSIVPMNGTLIIDVSFEATAAGSYTFSWRHIYVAYQDPPIIPTTVDVQDDTQAQVTSTSPPPSPPLPPFPPPPPPLPTPEVIEALPPEEAAEILAELDPSDAANILKEIDPENVANILEEMKDGAAVEILKELDPEDAANILTKMNDDDAAKLFCDMEVSNATDILQEMNQTEAADLLNAAIMNDMTHNVSNILLEMEENATSTILLEIESENGAALVETMAQDDLNGAAKRVEAAIKLRLTEVDEEKAQEILEKMADVLENVNVESLVDLFIEITTLPHTPETVAAMFEVMDQTKVLDVVSAWISTGALEELADVFDNLTPATISNVYLNMTSIERTILYPYFSEETIAKLPSLAKFEVSHISATPAQVEIGEAVTISVRVSNIGESSGDYTLTLKVDGIVEETKNISLEANASTIISFNVVKSESGVYSVDVNGLTIDYEVTKPLSPADFEVSNLNIHPTEIQPDEAVTISVTISNVGEESGTYIAEVIVDGSIANSETVTLNGGASASVSLTVTSTQEGSHTVEVDGQTGSFTVSKPPPDIIETYADVQNIILFGAIFILGIAVIYFLVKPK